MGKSARSLAVLTVPGQRRAAIMSLGIVTPVFQDTWVEVVKRVSALSFPELHSIDFPYAAVIILGSLL